MLAVQQLIKSFSQTRIIENVSLSLRRGETVGLLGPNGAGKTTMIRMLIGLIVPDSGRIELDGADITRLPFHERASRGINYLPQEPFVPRALSVEDNIAMVLEVREPAAPKRDEKLAQLVGEFHLDSVRKTRVSLLSGGMRRRLEVAITLACDPTFALFDEPFAGIDPRTVEEIAALIRQLARHSVGVLVTDHNARALLKLVDRAYVIESGHMLAQGPADAIIADKNVRRLYLGEAFHI